MNSSFWLWKQRKPGKGSGIDGKGDPSNDLIAIKYLESLEKVADGNATKIFLPADLSATLGSIGAISELFKDENKDSTESEDKEE